MRLRSAVRSLGRSPGFALAVIATIALGVGASTAMFAVVYAVLLRPLPYPDAGRVTMVWEKWQVDPAMRIDAKTAARLAERSYPTTQAVAGWRAGNHSFEKIAAYAPREFTVTGGGEPERVEGLVASPEFFQVLGRSPALGRGFTEDEDRTGADVVILGPALWARRFGQDPGVLGRVLSVDGAPHTIVGVLPADFQVLLPSAPRDPDVITTVPHSFFEGQKWGVVLPVGRLRRGVTVEAAQADMTAVVRHMAETNARYKTRGANVVPLADEMAREPRVALLVLFGATLCVLLIGCVNVANLLLVRAVMRDKEMTVRAALGAGGRRLVSMVFSESVALAAAGGAAGLVLAWWATRTFVALVPRGLFPRLEDVRVDPLVLGVGFALAVGVGLVAAIAPALRALGRDRRGGLSRALNDAQRTASVGRGHRLVRRALVTAQVALAMLLLVGAALLTETYVRLTRVDLGLDPHRVLTFGVTLPDSSYATPASKLAFGDSLLPRLEALPGVQAAGLINSLPVEGAFTASGTVAIEGQQDSHEFVLIRTASAGVFKALGIRLAYGRLLASTDAGTDVAVVNRVLVRRFWPEAPPSGPEPLGRMLMVGQRWCRIIGVVEDVKYLGPDGAVEKEAYVPLTYWPLGYLSAAVRTGGDPAAIAGLARQALRAVDPSLAIQHVRTYETLLAEHVAPPRFRFALVAAFAGLALVLAVIGLYGVISQSVTQRTREIGIRMALGAARPAIARMVLAEGLGLAGVGIAVGIAAAGAGTRVLTGFLFGVAATDAGTYAAVAIALLVVAAVAAWGPARRASRSDPSTVLREE